MSLDIATDDCWPSSGIGTFAHQVTTGLERSGHRMTRLSQARLSSLARFTPARPATISAGMFDCRDAIFFSPGFYAPLWWKGPRVATVHDLQYLDPKANPSGSRRRYFQQVLLPLLRKCDLTLTVSQESLDGLTTVLGPGHDIVVVGEGVDDAYFLAGKQRRDHHRQPPAADPASQDERASGFRLIYVGNWLAHKRAGLLVTAAIDASRRTSIELSLPINPPKAISAQLSSALKRLDTQLTVTIRPRLETAKLAQHVANSDLLILLSTHEGFGLPPIEAQAARTPVMVSEFDGARDRFGDSGAHFLPLDASVHAIAAEIVDLAFDRARRLSTVEPGVGNAESMRWPDVVSKVELALGAVSP